MKKKNFGHIVAVCSACGVVGLPYAVPYSASKFAVRGMLQEGMFNLKICNQIIECLSIYF